jgi:hypothetical protein
MLDHGKDLSILGGTVNDNRIVDNSTHTTYIGAKGGTVIVQPLNDLPP